MTRRGNGDPSVAEIRKAVLEGAHRMRSEGKPLYELITQAVEVVDRSVPTIYRWAASGDMPGRPGPSAYQLTNEDKAAVRDHRGVFAKAWEERRKKGVGVSKSTFERACRREFSHGDLATMREGYAGHVRHVTRIRRSDLLHSNQEWQIDAKMLDLFVSVPRHGAPIRPWVVTVIDAYDRGVRGFCVSAESPTTTEVLAAIYDAITISELSPLGGVPDKLVTDNGLEFLSNRVTALLLALGVVAHATDAYSPHQKGVIERFFRTQVQKWEKDQPLWVDGPKESNGELSDRRAPLHIDDLADGLGAFYRAYNAEHRHRALGGKTPAQVYAESSPPRSAGDGQLRVLLTERHSRKVTNHGIQHNNQRYMAPGLDDLVGEKVSIAVPPNDPDYIEVYSEDGTYVGRAVRPQSLSTAGRRRLLGSRKTTGTKRMRLIAGRDRRRARKNAAQGDSGSRRSSGRQQADVTERRVISEEEQRAGLESMGLEVFSAPEADDAEAPS